MAEFVTAEAARERFRALADQVDAAYAQMRALSSDGVGNEFRTELAGRLEFQERTNRGLMYRVFGDPSGCQAPALLMVSAYSDVRVNTSDHQFFSSDSVAVRCT